MERAVVIIYSNCAFYLYICKKTFISSNKAVYFLIFKPFHQLLLCLLLDSLKKSQEGASIVTQKVKAPPVIWVSHECQLKSQLLTQFPSHAPGRATEGDSVPRPLQPCGSLDGVTMASAIGSSGEQTNRWTIFPSLCKLCLSNM